MMCVLPTPASEPELLDLDLERLFDFDLLRDLDLDWRDPDLKVHQKFMRLVSLNLQYIIYRCNFYKNTWICFLISPLLAHHQSLDSVNSTCCPEHPVLQLDSSILKNHFWIWTSYS